MTRSASKIKMTSFNDLFDVEEAPTVTDDSIVNIPLSKLIPFCNHPYKVRDDELMEDTKESIAKNGVLVPIIVRPCGDSYEIIAGHRRKRACELLGIDTIPAIVRELDDEESTIVMVDTNIQRENLMFSEKAFAYKMKLEAIKKQGKRNDLTCDQVGHKLKARDTIAKDSGESGVQISRYIRLTELMTPLLDMTDDKKIAFNTAVELSYLTKKEQEVLLAKIAKLKLIPSMAQATKMKKYSAENGLSDVLIDSILSETAVKPVQITLKKDKLSKYFPDNYSSQQIEDVITTLLEQWKNER